METATGKAKKLSFFVRSGLFVVLKTIIVSYKAINRASTRNFLDQVKKKPGHLDNQAFLLAKDTSLIQNAPGSLAAVGRVKTLGFIRLFRATSACWVNTH